MPLIEYYEAVLQLGDCFFSFLKVLFMIPVSFLPQIIMAINSTVAADYATVFIAFCNLVFALYITQKERKDKSNSEKKNKAFTLFLLVVIFPKINLLYEFVDELLKKCEALKTIEPNDIESRSEVNSAVLSLMQSFVSDFIYLFNAIDQNLYEELKNFTDDAIDELTKVIIDGGLNLGDGQKYDEVIKQPILYLRNQLIRTIYSKT